VANAEESKQIVLDVIDNKPGPASDIVCLNAGATLYVAGVAKDIGSGVAMAKAAIVSGAARNKLDAFIAATQSQ
jgi:anthranilate phosphoribosyltransferase